ncbi:hypothetical protein D3C72_434450 [compost metagenome]
MAKEEIKELELRLEKLKAQEKEERATKRKDYESGRDTLAEYLCTRAKKLHEQMISFKSESVIKLNKFREQMLEYGDLRGGENNKGNFEIKTDQFKVVFSSQLIKRFDERAQLAEKRINEFLKRWLKKKDRNTYDFINNLMKRDDKTGQFDINMILQLYKMEDRFNDPDWVEGIALFKESYVPYTTAIYQRFYEKEAEGSWRLIPLDFAKLKTIEE